MPPDPWDWDVEDVVRALCHPQGQLRSQHPGTQLNTQELEATLRDNGIDGETLLVALSKEALKQDLEIRSLGLRFKIWKIIETARANSSKFATYQAENPDKFANSFINASVSEAVQRQSTTQSVVRQYLAKDVVPGLPPPRPTEDEIRSVDNLGNEPHVDITARRGEHVFIEESGRKRRRLTLAPKTDTYLETSGITVDSVFYGATPVGEEIDLGVRGREEEMNREGFFNWTVNETNGVLTHIEHCHPPKRGHSLYVNRLMRRHMLGNNANEPRFFKHEDTIAIGLQPTPSATAKSSLPESSLSVILNTQNEPAAYRVNAKDWKYYGTYTREKHKAMFPMRREQFQTSNPGNNWSFLDSYVAQDQDDDVVPLYGESGSEGGYDTETWNEIEAERLERGQKKQQLGLSIEEVRRIIDVEKTAMRKDWELKKLPLLQSRAWKIWSQSRLQNTLSSDLQSLQNETSRLVNRLQKFEENIYEMPWTRPSETQQQCQSLQPTVVDLAAAQWRLDLLQQSSAPPVQHADAVSNRPRTKARPSYLADDEEELTDSELDDGFVVNDTPANGDTSGIQQHVHASAADIDMEPPGGEDLGLRHSIVEEQERSYSLEPIEDMQESASQPQISSSSTLAPSQAAEPKQAKTQFRMPREIERQLPREPDEVILLSSSENETGAEVNGYKSDRRPDFLSMTLKQLRKEPVENIEDEGTARDKLAWIMVPQSHASSEISKLLKVEKGILQTLVLEAYKSLLSYSYKKIRAMPPDFPIDAAYVFTLALWFIPWSMNIFWWERSNFDLKSPRPSLVDKMVNGWASYVKQWDAFVAFVKERIDWFKRQESRSSKNAKERSKSTRAHFDSYRAMQPGQTQRENARERQLAAQVRREQLQKVFESSGAEDGTLDAIVNLDKTEPDEQIRINSHIARRLKPHQLEGVQFLWTEIVASGAKEGCLLAQPMGMGKTMQVIAFILTVSEASLTSQQSRISEQIPEPLRKSYVMILAPPSLVENWFDELLKWLPPDSSGTIGEIYKVTSALSVPERISIIKEWSYLGGILLLSTSMFRSVVLEGNVEGQTAQYAEVVDALRSRASIVVVDEAQEMKNVSSKLSTAVRQVTTPARIAMTGSPLANNLVEYFNLIDFVAEGYLGTLQDFRSRYITPITNGQYVDASKYQQRRGLKMQKVLTKDLAPKIHRADITQLHHHLHGKTEFIIRTQLTDLQLRCYRLYVESIQRRESDVIQMPRLWAFLSILKLLCNHPKCFHDKLVSHHVDSGPTAEIDQLDSNGRYASTFEVTDIASEALAQDPTKLLENEMLRRQLQFLKQPESLDAPMLSNKMVILFKIVELCRELCERVLIFSHSIPTMDYIEMQLRLLGTKMIRIDGSAKAELRQEQTKKFNEGNDEVALVSTRAGGVGLNLFGASRVVIMDDWFNPILEQQAIGRAYRIGQVKHVYVYRLIAAGSFEEELQNQALFKIGLANRVVDKKDTVRAASKNARTWLRQPNVTEAEDWSEARNRDSKVLERILQEQVLAAQFHSIKLGDSFLVEENEELTMEEEAEAAQLIEEERMRRTNPEQHTQWLAAKQAELIREATLIQARPDHSGARPLTGIQVALNATLPFAPQTQMTPEVPFLSQPKPPNESAEAAPQLQPEQYEEPKTTDITESLKTPERATDPEVIDLTLTGSARRESNASTEQASNDNWIRSNDDDDNSQEEIDLLGLQTKQEFHGQGHKKRDEKKSRQLILPDNTQARPVGTFGIDVAAMPMPGYPVEGSQALAKPGKKGAGRATREKILELDERWHARNKLLQAFTSNSDSNDPNSPAPQGGRSEAMQRRAAEVERQVFETATSKEQYHQLIETTMQAEESHRVRDPIQRRTAFKKLLSACTFAYQRLHESRTISKLPSFDTIVHLVQQIEAEANSEVRDIAYERQLVVPPQRVLLAHIETVPPLDKGSQLDASQGSPASGKQELTLKPPPTPSPKPHPIPETFRSETSPRGASQPGASQQSPGRAMHQQNQKQGLPQQGGPQLSPTQRKSLKKHKAKQMAQASTVSPSEQGRPAGSPKGGRQERSRPPGPPRRPGAQGQAKHHGRPGSPPRPRGPPSRPPRPPPRRPGPPRASRNLGHPGPHNQQRDVRYSGPPPQRRDSWRPESPTQPRNFEHPGYPSTYHGPPGQSRRR